MAIFGKKDNKKEEISDSENKEANSENLNKLMNSLKDVMTKMKSYKKTDQVIEDILAIFDREPADPETISYFSLVMRAYKINLVTMLEMASADAENNTSVNVAGALAQTRMHCMIYVMISNSKQYKKLFIEAFNQLMLVDKSLEEYSPQMSQMFLEMNKLMICFLSDVEDIMSKYPKVEKGFYKSFETELNQEP